MSQQLEKIHAIRDYIQARTTVRPQLAIILGSGLGALADEVEVDASFAYGDIPDFPVSTVPGHAGQLLFGRLQGKNVVVMQGRFHYYEGYPMRTIVLPIRVLFALGARTLVVTNAAGGLNAAYDPGDVMLISDQINLMGTNPLIGPNEEAFGPRFPDMTYAYAPDLQALARQAAERLDVTLREGVYVAVSGPSFETKAERRFLAAVGGDAVGMSTVPEVIAANHAGMRVLGFSAITNVATGGADQPEDSHEEVLEMAQVAGAKLVELVRAVVKAMPTLDMIPPDALAALIAADPTQIVGIIDHTLLKPDATSKQIEQLCQEARTHRFASVCINPIHVERAAALLEGSGVKVCTVVGFPLGAVTAADKVRETEKAIAEGATEVDMVINIGALKDGNDSLVEREIRAVVLAAHRQGVLAKVIIENGLLNDDEKVRACQLAQTAGADFVKTATGFSAGGATEEDVALMRRTVGPHMGVKAAGGIRSLADARAMIAAGANRIGTSTGVAIARDAAAAA
ncbi:MAG: purine-nucleoside phosphorylase [Candidatus Promineifilaceae bacterium]|nr:purine-nucleoside phosphorylase [Candidatus Promineifilaceae bacterium]